MKSQLTIFLCTAALQLQAQTAFELVRNGLAFDSAGEPAKAIEQYSQAIESDPDNSVIWFNRGISHMRMEEYSLAIVDFNRAILLDTGLTDAYYNRCLAYRNTENYHFALADISHYLNKFPNDTEAIQQRIALALEMKEFNQAQADLSKLHAWQPEDTALTMQLAAVAVLNKDYSVAEKVFTELILNGSSDPYIYMRRAAVRHLNGNYTGSMNDIHVFGMQHPGNVEAEKLKGNNYFFLKQFSDAANIFEKLLESDSLNGDVLADYGHCLLQLERYQEAETVLTRSIRSRNDAPAYAYLGRGLARYNLGLGDKACEDWSKSLRLGEGRAKAYLESHCKKESVTNQR